MKRKKLIWIAIAAFIVIAMVVYMFIRFRKKPKETGTKREAEAMDKTLVEAETLSEKVREAVSGNGDVIVLNLSDLDQIESDANVKVKEQKLTIKKGGCYRLFGTLQEGRIIVDTLDDVILILDGVSISCSSDIPLKIKQSSHTLLYQQEGTNNLIQNGMETDIRVQSEWEKESETTGSAIRTKGNLSIDGNGSLVIGGYCNNGILAEGNIVILNGTVDVASVGDGIQADGDVLVKGGTVTVTAGDDAIHADNTLTICDGNIHILKSNEGLEAHMIYIEGGDINIVASDDGVNANGGQNSFGGGRGFGGGPVFGGQSSKETDKEDSEETKDTTMPVLKISGGNLYVNAGGDGLDSNGDLLIEGGNVTVDGPTNSGNGALDSGSENGGRIFCNGGTVLAIGASGMAESFENESKQISFCKNFTNTFPANTMIQIADAKGKVICSHTSAKTFNSVVFSSSELAMNETYMLTIGDQVETITITGITNGDSSGGMFGNPGGPGEPGGFGGRDGFNGPGGNGGVPGGEGMPENFDPSKGFSGGDRQEFPNSNRR